MDKIGVKIGLNECLQPHAALGDGIVWVGDEKCLRVGVNPLGGGSYICVRLILGRII